ncbi:MAG: DUF58 domain-containing protein [Granulosicoccus sp.]
MSQPITEFVYKLPGTSSSSRPGAHRSRSRGSGMSFAAHARLFDQPDPRRLDLRASLTDIRGDWLVRTHLQRSSVPIKAIVDVSASMHFGAPGKLQVATNFLGALGHSANAYGDSVSLLAFDASFREDLYLPPRSGRGAGIALASAISSCIGSEAKAGSSSALTHTIDQISGTSGLVFLVSDFHWSLHEIEPVLDKLSSAMVVPIVIWDEAEVIPPPPGQLLPVRDVETGTVKRLWLRNALRKRWLDNVQQRQIAIQELFAQHDVDPFFIRGDFNAENLSRYFMEKVA